MNDANSLLGVKRPSSMVFRPQEMTHRFGSKADFIKYFRESRKWFTQIYQTCL